MNRVNLSGRLTRDPDVTRTQDGLCISRWPLAVDRRNKNKDTDFPSCVAFGRTAEFAENYLRKGMKIICEGRIQTGSYTNRDGQKVYTTDVVVDSVEFCESKQDDQQGQPQGQPQAAPQQAQPQAAPQQGQPQGQSQQQTPTDNPGETGFMEIPDDAEEELPFN